MDPFERSTTVDPEVRAYISSLVNAVGGSSTYDNTYSIGDDAVAVLKDLQRWLRLYDEKTNRLDVKRCLAEANLVKGDLLEILALWPEEATDNKHTAKLALACLELIVPLTWPLSLEDERATINHHRHVPYLQLAQVGYKRAILHFEFASILRTAVRVALPAMAQPRRERNRRDEGIIKLVLYLFRNMAMIIQPQHLPSQGDENEVGCSATVEAFHSQDIFSVLLAVGSGMGDEFQEQDVILLEILFHLLKGVDARKLFLRTEQVATEETQELKTLLQKEKAMLNGYKRHAPTRHHRFGTMIWVKRGEAKMSTVSGQSAITSEDTTLLQMDASKKWNKPQYRGKVAQEVDEIFGFGNQVELTPSARTHLCTFVEDFLDSSFNPLFASLRKAIEREADRLLSMHNRQYFFLVSWFLTAQAARRNQSQREANADRRPADAEDNTFAYIAAVLDQETFVLLNRQMQSALDNKNWLDLQSTLLCFTRILLTVQDMAESQDEEDQEIAENIQNRIFYEEATHDRLVQILRGYQHQGFAYLDAVTECIHVFIRMLERYSKQNVDLQIRSKRRARKKARQRDGEPGGDDAGEDAEDVQEAHRAVSERKFDFAKFSAKFLSQPCVNTFISLTHFYHDLKPTQLKRAHRFLYRLACKHELTVLLFRVDILQLFLKMVKGTEALNSEVEGFRDWEQLVQHVFRRCIKWMERGIESQDWKEIAVVEMLFSKIPSTVFYLQNGFEKVVERRPARPPAELEIKKSVPEEQRVSIAASVMIERAKADALGWVKEVLENAATERQAWADERDLRLHAEGPTADETILGPLSAPSIFVPADSDERKVALYKDKHLRLLLTTLGFQRLGLAEDTDAEWIIPPELTASKLKGALEQIKKAEFDPETFEDEKRAEDYVHSKPSARHGATFNDFEDENEDNVEDLDEEMFPPNMRDKRRKRDNEDNERPKKRRKRHAGGDALDEEELEERRKMRLKKDRERNAKIKSKLFVTDSDEESDEERDVEFFRLEEERRNKMDGIIRNSLLKQKGHADEVRNRATSSKAVKRKSKEAVESNEDDSASDEDDPLIIRERPAPIFFAGDLSPSDSEEMDDGNGGIGSDSEPAEGKTPSTSPSASFDTLSSTRPLKEASANTVQPRTEESEDEDSVPIKRPAARRNLRAGFIVDDDESE